jgi:hypothetical protein
MQISAAAAAYSHSLSPHKKNDIVHFSQLVSVLEWQEARSYNPFQLKHTSPMYSFAQIVEGSRTRSL